MSGWKVSTSENYTIRYSEELVEFILDHQAATNATTSWADYGQVFGTITRPGQIVNFMEQYGSIMLRVNTNGKLQKKSITGSNVNANSLVAYAVWKKQ